MDHNAEKVKNLAAYLSKRWVRACGCGVCAMGMGMGVCFGCHYLELTSSIDQLLSLVAVLQVQAQPEEG
jgi:hypothetical protein